MQDSNAWRAYVLHVHRPTGRRQGSRAEGYSGGAVMSEITNRLEYLQRLAKARRAPKADMHTRMLLIVSERGLTQKQLQKFYFTRRKGSKPRFDYFLFAQKQQISLEWLMDGVLSLHPRHAHASGPRLPRPLAGGDAA